MTIQMSLFLNIECTCGFIPPSSTECLWLWPFCCAQVGFSALRFMWNIYNVEPAIKLPPQWAWTDLFPRNTTMKRSAPSLHARAARILVSLTSQLIYDDGKYLKFYCRRSQHPTFPEVFPPAVQGTCAGVYSGCLAWLDSAVLPAGIWKSGQGNIQQHFLHHHYCPFYWLS